jgi:hypothetical protein
MRYYDDWSRLRGVILQTGVREVNGEEKKAVWRRIRRQFTQSRKAGRNPRLTLALRIVSSQQWGIAGQA